jgi:hypothetical protein
MLYDPLSSPEPFSLTGIIAASRGGSFPDCWLDDYTAYLWRSHARAAAEIAAIFAAAESDPAALERLKNARF